MAYFDAQRIEFIKTFLAFEITFLVIAILMSFWWDVFYIRKNGDITTNLLFGQFNDYSLDFDTVGWREAANRHHTGFTTALLFNRFPSRAKNYVQKARKRGHSESFIIYPALLEDENYKKIVALNPRLMCVVRVRLWFMVIVAISAAIFLNL